MLELFDRENGNYYLPSGKKVTSSDLKVDPQYQILFEKDCIVDVEDSVITSIQLLSNFAKIYGLDYSSKSTENAKDIFDQVIQKKNVAEASSLTPVQDIVRKAASFAALSFTDEQALEVPDLYPSYEVDHAYKKDERFTYNGRLFKVNQAHTSAAQWVPGETGTESLYTCLEMAGDGYLVWTQPTGAHNAYNTGDIVHYPTADDPLYKSKIDGNTTIPGSDERWWELYIES